MSQQMANLLTLDQKVVAQKVVGAENLALDA